MLCGTVYHCPASEFQRMTYLVGSESGVMEEWADDVDMCNARCRRFADVGLTNPLRVKIDDKWECVWLHDHVVRVTGCMEIPEYIVARVNEGTYQVKFIYPTETLELLELNNADMTRIRHWFHKEIEVGTTMYPVDPLHTLLRRGEQISEAKQSCPPACPYTSIPTLVETAQSAEEAPPLPTQVVVPTTSQTSA